MKKIVMLIVMLIAVAAIANTGGVQTYEQLTNADSAAVYYHYSNDFNDANVMVMANFHGELVKLRLDPNGTDPNRSLIVAIDPPEKGTDDQTHKLYNIKTFDVNTATDWFEVMFTIRDPNDNPYGTYPDCGDLYFCLRDTSADANDANNINDLLVYGTVWNK